MTRLTGLADHLRKWGFHVVELPGWKDRGADFHGMPKVCVCHHTGTPRSSTKDLPTQNVLVGGRSDLPGPLCQVGYGYSGTVYMVAAGKANHAGKGHWAGLYVGNESVGIEAESPGDGTWTAAQREGYPRLAAAIQDYLDSDAAHICAHRESAEPHGRKDDPVGIDMNDLRKKAAAHLKAGPAPVKPQTVVNPTPIVAQEADMFLAISPSHHTSLVTPEGVRELKTNAEKTGLTKLLKQAGGDVASLTDAEYSAVVAVLKRPVA